MKITLFRAFEPYALSDVCWGLHVDKHIPVPHASKQARRNDFDIEGGGLRAKRTKLFSRPRPFDRWKTPLFYKLHNLIDKQMMIFRCLTDDDHYLQNL